MTPAQYRIGLDGIVQKLLVVILPVLRVLFRPGLSDEVERQRRVNRATKVLVAEIRVARVAVGKLTELFLRAQARSQDGQRDPFIPPLAGYPDEAVRAALKELIDEHLEKGTRPSTAVEQAGSRFVRHAEQAGRQMIVDAVEPDEGVPDDTVAEKAAEKPEDSGDDTTSESAENGSEPDAQPTPDPVPEPEPEPRKRSKDRRRPVAWARGLTGADNCAFCVMLASRGAVYKSKSSAKNRYGDPFLRYHDNCDCVPIPVYTSADWPGKDTADALYKLWLDSTKGYTQQDAINALRRELYRKKKAGEELVPGFTPMREAA